MAKTYKTTFKDAQAPQPSGSSDLNFEGSSHPISGDLEINGKKPIVTVGEGKLDEILSNFR